MVPLPEWAAEQHYAPEEASTVGSRSGSRTPALGSMAGMTSSAVRAAGTEGPTEAAALAALEEWDHRAALDSIGASVFHMVNEKLVDAVMADELSPELYEKGMGHFMARVSLSGLVDRMANAGIASALWDDRRTERVETADAVIHSAFRDAVAELERYHGERVDRWRWGELHRQFFAHPFSRIAPFTSRAQRDADLRLLLHAADARAVTGARVDDDVGALRCVRRDVRIRYNA